MNTFLTSRLLLIIGMTITINCLMAQTIIKENLKFGIKGGGNLTTVTGNDKIVNTKTRFAFHGGFYGNYSFAKKMSGQMEVLYNRMGANLVRKDDAVKGYWKQDYISVPILFQYHLMPKFHVESGPQIDIGLSFKSKMENTSESNIKESMKSVTGSWVFGTGYKLTEKVGVNLRYTVGLGTPYLAGTAGGVDSFRNKNFQFGLSCDF